MTSRVSTTYCCECSVKGNKQLTLRLWRRAPKKGWEQGQETDMQELRFLGVLFLNLFHYRRRDRYMAMEKI